MLILVASWGAQAADAVAPIYIEFWSFTKGDLPNIVPYPTLDAACQDYAATFRQTCPIDYAGSSYDPNLYTVPYSTLGQCNYIIPPSSPPSRCNYIGGDISRTVTHFPSVCPGASPPYTYDPSTQMCVHRPKLTITLSGGTEVEPSNGSTINTLPFIASVKDQNTGQPPTIPVTVKISLKVDDPKSGGHDHGTSDRPRGGVGNVGTCASDDTCWSWDSPANNGVVVFNLNPTETSGKYIISATCGGCSNTETAKVNVKVKEAQADDLKPIPASSLYALQDSSGTIIGAIPHKHEDNHHLTAAAVVKLKDLANAYNAIINPGKILYLNDASLEWGGLFDVGSTQWKSPHKGHRHGVEIDIRAAAAANGNPVKEGAIPFDLFWQFWSKAKEKGIKADLHCMENRQLVIGSSCYWLPEARHYHVQLK